VRAPESLVEEKSLSTVCDVVEISSKTLKETIVRVLEFLSQETSVRIRRFKQKSPFDADFCLGETFEMLKRSRFFVFLSSGLIKKIIIRSIAGLKIR